MKYYSKIAFLGLISSASMLCAASTPELSSSQDVLNQSWMDKRISPSEDFYAYANGNWLKNNPIPPEYASWGTFNVLNEQVLKQVHEMLIKASQNTHATPGSIEQKVGDFYFSGMDEKTINEVGIKPLLPEFNKIEGINSLSDLHNAFINLHQKGVDALFGFGSMQDFKNSNEMIGVFVQSGLGLPDRDYYLKDDEKFKKIRVAYVDHMSKMFELLGDDKKTATHNAESVMRLETQLAQASMSQIQQRDPHAIYHMMSPHDLDKMAPYLHSFNYLEAIGQSKTKPINCAMPEYFKKINGLLKSVPLSEWKTYLKWHLIDAYASYLSQPFVDQNFKMATVLSGAEKLQPRWKRVVSTENGALGFAIGELYVAEHFSPASKEAALKILNNIRKELRKNISTLSWMSPETRQEALKKLDTMDERVGYPTQWWDYSLFKVDRGPYVLNVMRANEFLVKRDLNKIGKPIDKTEWAMTPQTINAYYDPSMNQLNIPAGILQAPFFSPNAPAAVNYGAMGFVMGHEMTHGFDDQGAQFDAHGNLKNWWTQSDLSRFKEATECIARQFSKYTVNGNLPVQGKLVVGEATADLGGITLALRAYHQSDEYKNAKVIDGLTPDQQFFLGVAHVWAINMRPEQLRNQVTTDPHPPARYRVNGSLANMPEFQQAFNIPKGSPMHQIKPCVIW